jgi:hypothetical protein
LVCKEDSVLEPKAILSKCAKFTNWQGFERGKKYNVHENPKKIFNSSATNLLLCAHVITW